eukprot:5776413-Prymnesium_polylepis.1
MGGDILSGKNTQLKLLVRSAVVLPVAFGVGRKCNPYRALGRTSCLRAWALWLRPFVCPPT